LATTPTGRPDGPNAPYGTSPSSSPTPAQTRSRIDEALAARDLCELYDALADLEVSGKTVREFRQGMLVVLGAVRSAQSFVPEDIATSWATLVAQTERVVEVLGESNATVSSAASVFQDSTYRDAMDRTDQWMGESCAG